MADNVQPSGGASNWLGYAFADPTNPQAPQTTTAYLPTDPDKTAWTSDPKRTAVAAASGTIWANGWVVDEDGSVKVTVAFPMFHNYGQGLVFGFFGSDSGGSPHAAVFTRPRYMCFEFNESGVSTQVAGCLPTKLSLETQSKGVPMITLEYEGTVLPVEITPSVEAGSAPTYDPPTDQVYSWPDFQSATLLADGAGVKSIDQFSFEVTMNPDLFHGNTGQGLPSDIIPTLGEVSGKFVKLLKGTTAEITRFIQDGRTPGILTFGWQSGADSVTITLNNSVYKTASRKGGIKKATLEDFAFECLAPSGKAPLIYTVANSTFGSYTP